MDDYTILEIIKEHMFHEKEITCITVGLSGT